MQHGPTATTFRFSFAGIRRPAEMTAGSMQPRRILRRHVPAASTSARASSALLFPWDRDLVDADVAASAASAPALSRLSWRSLDGLRLLLVHRMRGESHVVPIQSSEAPRSERHLIASEARPLLLCPRTQRRTNAITQHRTKHAAQLDALGGPRRDQIQARAEGLCKSTSELRLHPPEEPEIAQQCQLASLLLLRLRFPIRTVSTTELI